MDESLSVEAERRDRGGGLDEMEPAKMPHGRDGSGRASEAERLAAAAQAAEVRATEVRRLSDAADAAWQALFAVEESSRNLQPTHVDPLPQRPAPDLSQTAN